MRLEPLFVALFVLVSVTAGMAGAQTDAKKTPRELYQEARAEEFSGDKEKGPNRINDYYNAFIRIAEATEGDAQYVPDFARITRKYLAGTSVSYFAEYIIRVGKKRENSPVFKSVAQETVNRLKKDLSAQGYAPGKTFVQVRKGRDRPYCNVPSRANEIFQISTFVYPVSSPEVMSWGKYAGDLNMATLRGCGGEGSDMDPQPNIAFPIYSAIKYRPGMQKASKMLGDESMRNYIYGGSEKDSPYTYHESGFRPFYDKAMKFY